MKWARLWHAVVWLLLVRTWGLGGKEVELELLQVPRIMERKASLQEVMVWVQVAV